MIELESERLFIRELTADDLPAVLPVYLSNPDVVRRMEGSEGEVGRYNLERWQRDWSIASLMPGRHTLGCYLKASQEAVGYIDFLAENEEDGCPWLGQLLIARSHQRQDLATEAFQRLAQHFRDTYDWLVLRAWVLEDNEEGLAFLRSVGFRVSEQPLKEVRLPGGAQRVVALEYGFGEDV